MVKPLKFIKEDQHSPRKKPRPREVPNEPGKDVEGIQMVTEDERTLSSVENKVSRIDWEGATTHAQFKIFPWLPITFERDNAAPVQKTHVTKLGCLSISHSQTPTPANNTHATTAPPPGNAIGIEANTVQALQKTVYCVRTRSLKVG